MPGTGFEQKFRTALKAGRERNYTKAVQLLEALAVENEGEANIYLYLGRSWHALREYPKAIQYFRMYVRLSPEEGDGWFFLGRSYLADGLYAAAVSALKKSLIHKSDSLAALTLLGTAWLKSKHSSAALKAFEQALCLAPDDEHLNQGYRNALFIEAVRVLKKGDGGTASQMFSFLLKNGMDSVLLRLYAGHSFRDAGHGEEALRQYQAACELAPDDSSLQWYCASVLLEMGRTADARRLIGTLEGGNAPGTGWTEQAVSLRIVHSRILTEKWQEAVEAGRFYIKKYGDDAAVHTLMGEALRNLRKPDLAENHFRRAETLEKAQGSSASGAPRYGILMTLVGSGDWEALSRELGRRNAPALDADTLAYYRTLCAARLGEAPAEVLAAAQKLFPSHNADPEIMYVLASQYLALGLTDLALGWYRRASELRKDYEEAHLGLIACLEVSRAPKELESAYTAYLSLWPDNTAIRRDFATFLQTRKRWADAADEAERIIPFEGTSDSLERQMAFYRRKAGQYRQAAILYRGILRRKPSDTRILYSLVFCLDKMGAGSAALALLRQGNKAVRTSAEGILIEAVLLMRTKKKDDALDTLRRGAGLYPKDWRFPQKTADIYRSSGIAAMANQYDGIAAELRKKI